MTDNARNRAVPAINTATIHVACCRHRQHGSTYYRAVAIVTNTGCKGYHTRRVAIDDNKAAAMNEAVEHVMTTYRMESLPVPTVTRIYGVVSAVDIDTVTFYKSE